MYVTFFNHFNHCCISSAAAQKQSTCKCQRMDSRVARVAQRSMIRTKQRMYISTHAPYILQRARAHTHTLFRERERTHTIYFTGEETMQKHSYAHIHTAVINRRYSMQSACAPPSSITAAFPVQLRKSREHANVRAWTHFMRSDRWFAQSKVCTSAHTHHI